LTYKFLHGEREHARVVEPCVECKESGWSQTDV
jgi:hypothetical protein